MSDAATQDKSETGYKFGDPVWVIDRDGIEREAYYGEMIEQSVNRYDYWCLWRTPNGSATLDWFKDIRPRQPPTVPLSGWRLPEPGDVVRVKDEFRGHVNPKHVSIELTVVDTFLIAGKFTVRGNGLDMQYPFPHTFELVRLRDTPVNPSETLSKLPQPLPLNPFADLISSVVNQYPDELVRNTALAALKVLVATAQNPTPNH